MSSAGKPRKGIFDKIREDMEKPSTSGQKRKTMNYIDEYDDDDSTLIYIATDLTGPMNFIFEDAMQKKTERFMLAPTLRYNCSNT